MTQLISYTRRVDSVQTEDTPLNLPELYHNLYSLMERLHTADGFDHSSLLKIAAAMDLVKRLQHQERN